MVMYMEGIKTIIPPFSNGGKCSSAQVSRVSSVYNVQYMAYKLHKLDHRVKLKMKWQIIILIISPLTICNSVV